jgi:hypothetical protein
MTREPRHGPDLDPADPHLAMHLTLARPVPRAGFRGRLGRHLAGRDPGYGPRPERLRLMVAGYLGTGGLLIVLVGLGVA